MHAQYDTMLSQLEGGTLNPQGFSHRHHVGVTVAALQRYPFFKAMDVVAGGLERLAIRANVPDKFHATLTLASFCLIAERLEKSPGATPDELMAHYPELLTADLLRSLYPTNRLASELARKVGLLPMGLPAEESGSGETEGECLHSGAS